VSDTPEYLPEYKSTGICIRPKVDLTWCPASDWSHRNATEMNHFPCHVFLDFGTFLAWGCWDTSYNDASDGLSFINLSHHFLNPSIIWTPQHIVMRISTAQLCMANVVCLFKTSYHGFFFLSSRFIYYRKQWINISYPLSPHKS